ncbi:PQQ-binding-like beta-propeller repeat protein [bacterium]|nr:PQQ-binding-like beta-propeller repeat protein [bacterium]
MRKAICLGLLLTSRLWAQDWVHYGQDEGGARFSRLDQISPATVSGLRLAWCVPTEELKTYKGTQLAQKAAFECTPLKVGRTLYVVTPTNRVLALDPVNGSRRWVYDPLIDKNAAYSEVTCRGLAFSQGRLYLGTLDSRLIALDAETGKVCADFGKGGQIDLKSEGKPEFTSPPAVLGELVVVGWSGGVRAFDRSSGAPRWSWDPVPRKAGETGYESWKGSTARESGRVGAGPPISVDTRRNLIFVSTSSPRPEHYGAERRGDNLMANSVVALNALDGRPRWSYQVVHHDLWGYDVPMQPMLLSLPRGKEAVAVGTRMGHLFVLDRDTGLPVFPVEERPVLRSDVEGEESSPTQPFPSQLPVFGLRKVDVEEAWGPDEAARGAAREWIARLRSAGIYTPPSLRGSVLAPGQMGGFDWGGLAYDAEKGLLIGATNRIAGVVTLVPRAQFEAAQPQTESRLGMQARLEEGTPYVARREVLVDGRDNLRPLTKPPWGTLAAIDLAKGELAWEVPLGSMLDPAQYPDSEKWGSLSLGGPSCTAGGLTFVAATLDGHLRAFETSTGKLLWKSQLPVPAHAAPMTYEVEGKQYVIICAGGSGSTGRPLGESVLAFALP